jgi:hypothetical protein
MKQLLQSRTPTENSSPVLSLRKRRPNPPKKPLDLFENRTPSCNSRSNSTARIKNGRKPHPHNPADHVINILQPVAAAAQHHCLPSTPVSTNSSSTNPNQKDQRNHHNPITPPSPSHLHASTSPPATPSEFTTFPPPHLNNKPKNIPRPNPTPIPVATLTTPTTSKSPTPSQEA